MKEENGNYSALYQLIVNIRAQFMIVRIKVKHWVQSDVSATFKNGLKQLNIGQKSVKILVKYHPIKIIQKKIQ